MMLAGAACLLLAVSTTALATLPRNSPRATRAAAGITLHVPDTLRTNLDLYRDYDITVDTSSTPLNNTYSSFSVQVHSQLFSVFLTNYSSCRDPGCTAVGSNVGLVQIWNRDMPVFPFRVRVECGLGECSRNSSVEILLAVTAISTEAPIPGGCTLTSDLFIDPNLALNYTSYSTVVQFQDSDVGFRPWNESYPICDKPVPTTSSLYPLQHLDYTVYQKCLGRAQFSASAMMDAVEDMLTAALSEEQENSYTTLQYNDLKTIQFSSVPGQGVVYNVIATDKRTGAKVAYVPAITYACDIHSQGKKECHDDVAPFSAVIGVLLVASGLSLCLLGHIFFHAEVALFHWTGGCFFSFTILSIIAPSMEVNFLLGLSLVFGTLYSILWFLFWFLTAWHWLHVIFFGLYADFLIIAAILYSPLEDTSVFTVLQISYVYYLTLFCGMVLFMVPLVAFPRALSIWTSALVGSYSVIFGVGMFRYTELSQIVLLVVRKLSISGFYSAHIDCPLMTSDYVLMAVWLSLLLIGVATQTTVVQIRRTKHNRRQRSIANRRDRTKFNSFPSPSLLIKLVRCRNRNSPEAEPLLPPNRLCTRNKSSATQNVRLPSDDNWSPSNSGTYPSNYGAMGATTVNGPPYKK